MREETPRNILARLAEHAAFEFLVTEHQSQLRHCLREGRPIPEHCKPGALIKRRCSPEEREILSHLTSNDVRNMREFRF